MSDELIASIGFAPAPLRPQLFIMRSDGPMIAMATKILKGLEYIFTEIVNKVDTRFTLGTVVHCLGPMHLFGINLFQHDDMSAEVNAEDKQNGIAWMRVCRLRRGDIDFLIKLLIQKSFASFNASICWLGLKFPLLCSEDASRLQQLPPSATVRDHCAHGL